jgi:hypothetical protein
VRHTLFAGTTVLELNTDHGGDVIALVTATGIYRYILLCSIIVFYIIL